MIPFDRQSISLWAKKEEKNGQFLWLPLIIHLTDTMNVCKWLWLNWLSDSQRRFCINSISSHSEEIALKLAAFLGAIHDIGKATPAFQIQKGFNNSPVLDVLLLEKLERSGFYGISSLVLASPHKTHHSIAGEYLLKKDFRIKDDISSIIGGHHGKPVDDIFSIEDQSAYLTNYNQEENPDSDIYKKWTQIRYEIFQWALEASGFKTAEELPEISQPAQIIYSGLLIMADWISSNQDFFPLIDINEEQVPNSNARYKNGIKMWFQNHPLQLQSYPDMSELFMTRFGYEPRDFQAVTYKTISHINNPGIIILEAPMGLGKTEAALASAEIVAAKTGSSGLFFGLPTQATSNGMFGRVHNWLINIANENNTKQSLRLCHGKAALNEEMNDLRNSSSPQNINIDERKNESVFVNEWFSGRKKTALDDFIVGTVDGFLLTALKQKHLALKHLGISKKVVIIDEVHAYDTYMQQYLEEAIRWMGAYGVPVILVSATLPKETRKNMLTAYLKGAGIKGRDIQLPNEISDNNYPLISYTDGTNVKAQTDFSRVENKTVYIEKMGDEEILKKLAELTNDNGVVGVIVNTVKKAQRLGTECKKQFGEDMVDILHSAFIATDRINKEANLLKTIGKQGNRPKKKIIIGTQVIEQSLDIDFDVLITDLCPIDLLLQRIGRLHRHNISRPEKHKKAVVYVLGTNEQLKFEKGSELVYGKYFLIRTQYYLPKQIRVPSDIPILINEVYGDKVPKLSSDLFKAYEKSRIQMKTLKAKQSDKAHTYLINSPRNVINAAKYNLIGWLKNPDRSESEEMATAQVRDIQETIEVIAVKRIGNGYGTFEKNEDVSKRIKEPQIAKELCKQTIRIPYSVTIKNGFAKTVYELEKYNLEHLREWQNSPWLKGSLGIVFDEKGLFDLNGVLLKYDTKIGLREE